MEMVTMVQATELAAYCERMDCVCRQCGSELNWLDKVKCWLSSSTMAVVNQRYCPGGKEPTELVGLPEAMMRGSSERLNVCAGVTEPHLHLTCRSCGFEWLMKVKGAA
jgi:hypothetical protein